MRIVRGIFSRYNNLIFAVLEVRWRAYYNMVLNFVEVFALIITLEPVLNIFMIIFFVYVTNSLPSSAMYIYDAGRLRHTGRTTIITEVRAYNATQTVYTSMKKNSVHLVTA